MQVRSVTVGYGWSINLGNYESTRLDLSITADVDEGENDGDIRHDLLELLKGEVRQAAVDALKGDIIKKAHEQAAAEYLKERAEAKKISQPTPDTDPL